MLADGCWYFCFVSWGNWAWPEERGEIGEKEGKGNERDIERGE